MKHRAAAEHRAVADLDVAREQAVVRDDRAVADANVMAEVRADHHEVAVADNGGRAFLRAAMDRDVLAKGVAVADADFTAHRLVVGEVLRRRADHGSVADDIACAHYHAAREHGVAENAAAVANDDLRPDECVGTDLDFRAKHGAILDDGGGMNFHNRLCSLKLKYGCLPSSGAPMTM